MRYFGLCCGAAPHHVRDKAMTVGRFLTDRVAAIVGPAAGAMTLIVPWLVFPLVLGALALGAGLLLAASREARLAGAVLAPLGLARPVCVPPR